MMRMKRALDEMVVGGVETILPLHRRLVTNTDVLKGDYDIHWLENFLKDAPKEEAPKRAPKGAKG
jgi:acetyl-CoA carboxylase, biotin carboxylase subunit